MVIGRKVQLLLLYLYLNLISQDSIIKLKQLITFSLFYNTMFYMCTFDYCWHVHKRKSPQREKRAGLYKMHEMFCTAHCDSALSPTYLNILSSSLQKLWYLFLLVQASFLCLLLNKFISLLAFVRLPAVVKVKKSKKKKILCLVILSDTAFNILNVTKRAGTYFILLLKIAWLNSYFYYITFHLDFYTHLVCMLL